MKKIQKALVEVSKSILVKIQHMTRLQYVYILFGVLWFATVGRFPFIENFQDLPREINTDMFWKIIGLWIRIVFGFYTVAILKSVYNNKPLRQAKEDVEEFLLFTVGSMSTMHLFLVHHVGWNLIVIICVIGIALLVVLGNWIFVTVPRLMPPNK